MDESYSNPDNDFAPWTSSDPYAPEANTHQGMVYAVQNPFNGELIYPTNGRHWAIDQEDIKDSLNGWCEYELREIDDANRRAAICGVSIETVRSRVKAIIVDKLGVDESEVTPEATFTNDLGADSLDTVELIMELEKEFNITIPDDQAEKITTVGDAISYVEANAK